MGCDIHLWVEKCTGVSEYGEKTWEVIEKAHEPRPDSNDWDEKRGEWYGGRNYDLFSILANVRNGYGVAGCKTGEGFEPLLPEKAHETAVDEYGDTIGRPPYDYDRDGGRVTVQAFCRGVPKDASDKFKAEVWGMSIDGHSHSFLTLAELNAYDWKSKTATKTGIVTAAEFIKWSETHKAPVSWCGGISGPGIKVISKGDMIHLVMKGIVPRDIKDPNEYDGAKATDGVAYYTSVEWTVDYADAAGDFLTRTIPLMNEYAKAHGLADDQMRIVFFFDN